MNIFNLIGSGLSAIENTVYAIDELSETMHMKTVALRDRVEEEQKLLKSLSKKQRNRWYLREDNNMSLLDWVKSENMGRN